MRITISLFIILSTAAQQLWSQSDAASSPADLFGGLEKERKELFAVWLSAQSQFNATFFPLDKSKKGTPAAYCSPGFSEGLKRVKTAFDASHRKQKEYFSRWLQETRNDIRSRQLTIGKLDEQHVRVQESLKLKEQELTAMSGREEEISQLIKEDSDRGKAVQEAWHRAMSKSKESVDRIRSTSFNRGAAKANLQARIADLDRIQSEIVLSLEAIEADKEFQISYHDLRESEVDLRCNSRVRPGDPLLSSPDHLRKNQD